MVRPRVLIAVLIVHALVAAPSYAQTTGHVPLSHLVLDLFDIRLDSTPIFVPDQGTFTVHAPHFTLREPGLGSPSLEPVLFIQSLTAQLSTFPLGSSSGGFTYSFDPAIGTFRRTSQTFGPAFAERAVTLGRRRVNFGANYQHLRIDSFEGRSLRDSELVFFVEHQRVGSFVEGDLIETVLTLDVTRDTVDAFANYGVTDRLDVGIAVPMVRVAVDARRDATILRLATQSADTHRFADGTTQSTRTETGSAFGLGDVVLRGKYSVLQRAGGGLAAGVDLRLATGEVEDFLGTGETQARVSLIASTAVGRFSPHVNLGYTFSGDSGEGLTSQIDIPDELNYAVGVEAAVEPRLTIVADLVGRSLRGFGRMRPETRNHSFSTSNASGAPVQTVPITQLRLQEGESVNLGLGALGVKLNVVGNLLVSGSVLFPVTQAGLRPGISTAVGFDYAF